MRNHLRDDHGYKEDAAPDHVRDNDGSRIEWPEAPIERWG
jgi:hypothetical protein